jgi:uncharacterized membrane protein YjgN (DUF898 family)
MHETITSSSAAASAIRDVIGTRVEFSGDRREFRRLVLHGAFLELITLGFYRFWLATDIRRHFWSHTSVDGDALEYIGTAKELLLGFLFALAIFAPIYILYFFAGIEAERLLAFASIAFILFFFLFAQFAIYRARRYRVTRTVWRGVRFWMTGSGVGYAWRAALWGILIIVSFGLALPWARAALERYKMRHTGYGDLQGRFEGTGWALFKRSWHLWLLAWPSLVVVIPLPFVYGAFKAIEWRWWVDGLRVGGVRFKSDLKTGALIGLYWKIIAWTALLLLGISGLIGAVFFGVIWAGKTPEQIAASNDVPTFILSVLTYAITALVFGALMRIYLMRDVWQRVASSMTVYGLAAANDVAAHGELASSLGEGFADSLDVGF